MLIVSLVFARKPSIREHQGSRVSQNIILIAVDVKAGGGVVHKCELVPINVSTESQ